MSQAASRNEWKKKHNPRYLPFARIGIAIQICCIVLVPQPRYITCAANGGVCKSCTVRSVTLATLPSLAWLQFWLSQLKSNSIIIVEKTRVRRRETKTPAANGYFAFCNYGNDEARKRKGYKFIWIRCVKLVSQIHINGSALEKCFGCIRPFLNCGSISLSRACMRFKLCMCKCGFHRDFLVALSVLGPLFIILLWLMPLPLPLPPLLYRCVPFLLFTYLRLIHL